MKWGDKGATDAGNKLTKTPVSMTFTYNTRKFASKHRKDQGNCPFLTRAGPHCISSLK